jgi:hypothetical protein
VAKYRIVLAAAFKNNVGALAEFTQENIETN